MNYPERAAKEIFGYIHMCKVLGHEPLLEDIQKIVQFHSAEEGYFRVYGYYPSNPQI